MDVLYDIIIIGAGPGGASAAIYTARAGLKTLILDRPGAGGSLAVTEHIANYPGVPGPIPGQTLVKTMLRQATAFGAEHVTGNVISVNLHGDEKQVFTNEGDLYTGKAVIIASGALERKQKIPGEEELLGRGVSTCATCDAPFYQGKRVIVAGNDDYAAEESLSLARFAQSLHFLTPSPHPAVAEELLDQFQALPAITVHRGWHVKAILGDDHVTGVRVTTPEGEIEMPADGVFLFLTGAKPTTSFLLGQLALDEQGAVITNAEGAASLPRVYAVGDARANHVKQAIIAAAEGCIAALALERDLHGRTKLALDYK